MLIRSQNKQVLVNLDQINSIIYDDFNKTVDAYAMQTHFRLGKYTSEEKALKVLDMIEAEYNAPIYINKIAYQYEKYDHEVFHMPEDNEVIV